MRFEPNNEKVFFNLAMLATDMKQFEDAAKWFQRTIEVVRVSSPHLTVSCCSLKYSVSSLRCRFRRIFAQLSSTTHSCSSTTSTDLCKHFRFCSSASKYDLSLASLAEYSFSGVCQTPAQTRYTWHLVVVKFCGRWWALQTTGTRHHHEACRLFTIFLALAIRLRVTSLRASSLALMTFHTF